MRVGYWTFDSPATPGYDYSGWGNDAILQNISPGRPLRAGGQFSGISSSNSSLTLPNTESLRPGGSSFYVEFWINIEEDGDIVGGQGMWSISFEDGLLYAYIKDMYGAEESGPIAELDYNTTHYVCVAFDRSVSTVYANVNGEKHGEFSIRGLKKLEPGTPPLYSHFVGVLDNLGVNAGSLDEHSAYIEYIRGSLTHRERYRDDPSDYFFVVGHSLPILFISYEEEEFVTDDDEAPEGDTLRIIDVAMDRFSVDDSQISINDYQLHNGTIWAGEMNGISLQHTGYLTTTQREFGELDEDIPLEDGEEEPESLEPPDYTGFIPSLEFVADVSNASGVIVQIDFQGGDRFTARVDGGQMVLQELGGGSISGPSGWCHVVANMYANRTEVFINGEYMGDIAANRSGFEDIRVLGDGVAPFTGIAGPVVLYESPLDEFNRLEHYHIAHAGKFALKFTEVALMGVGDDEYHAMQHDWSLYSA